ncbi:hypothetical protein HRW23_07705 [Streptomyces lunaelactis]|nr:hypothetical protein [Streptomyces lunaelactis]NUK00109.1 hypothetical protein [Streptomyces lunaelactis]NUK06923.1 hypothetical protein [Streptomyces lunaelactis]NUK15445.1 hypothetical protein [Streptomyces lunaelactis]NUK22389.1 hypothetical protein [Streptomyces lunaelactis]NUK33161.1 hypothetical protein [Streptomyces lunaelactis]
MDVPLVQGTAQELRERRGMSTEAVRLDRLLSERLVKKATKSKESR